MTTILIFVVGVTGFGLGYWLGKKQVWADKVDKVLNWVGSKWPR